MFRRGNSLAVRSPNAVVEALELKEGDEIELYAVEHRDLDVARRPTQQERIRQLREYRGLLLGRAQVRPRKRRMPDSPEAAFIDANVLLYLASADEQRPYEVDGYPGSRRRRSVSQLLIEIANVARRKMRTEWAETDRLSMRCASGCCRPLCRSPSKSGEDGLRLVSDIGCRRTTGWSSQQHCRRRCSVLLSADMHHGLKVVGRLEVRDPFACGRCYFPSSTDLARAASTASAKASSAGPRPSARRAPPPWCRSGWSPACAAPPGPRGFRRRARPRHRPSAWRAASPSRPAARPFRRPPSGIR